MQPLTDPDRLFLLTLARRTIETLLGGRVPSVPQVDSPTLNAPRATFVTLRFRPTGELRGCRGETRARNPLVASVVRTTVASATDDPRFDPITRAERDDLSIQISALTPMRRIDPGAVTLHRHGLLIVRGDRSGLLLPQVAAFHGLETVPAFLAALCRKAGLPENAWRDPEARLYGFETECWGDHLD